MLLCSMPTGKCTPTKYTDMYVCGWAGGRGKGQDGMTYSQKALLYYMNSPHQCISSNSSLAMLCYETIDCLVVACSPTFAFEFW